MENDIDVALIREIAKNKGETEKDKQALDKFKYSFAEQLKGIPNEMILSEIVNEEELFNEQFEKENTKQDTKESKIKRFFEKIGDALCQ